MWDLVALPSAKTRGERCSSERPAARRCGYSDAPDFVQSFKKAHSLTPLGWRPTLAAQPQRLGTERGPAATLILVREVFRAVARRVTLAFGSWQFFVVSLVLIVAWAATGPIFDFSDAWQLVINTATTILTYLFGILILLEANRQSKESKVVHDELLRAVDGARDELINVDELTDEEVDELQERLRDRARRSAAPGDALHVLGGDEVTATKASR